MIKKFCILFLFTLNCWGEPLTLDTCYRIALDNNPLKRASIEGVVIANEEVGMARAPYYPDVDINAHYRRFRQFFFLPNNPLLSTLVPNPVIGPINDWGLDVSSTYLLYDYGKRRAELDSALAQKNIAREEAERIKQQILLNVSLAFHSLIGSIELLKVAEETVQRAEAHYDLAKNRNDQGDVPAIDVYRTQVEVAQARQGLVRSRNAVRIAKGNLNTAMGLPPQLEVEVIPGLIDVIPPSQINIAEGLENSTLYRPEVRQALQRIVGSESQVTVAKSAFGPRVYAEGLYGKRQDIFFPWESEWTVGIEFEMSLFRGYEDLHNVRRARHTVCKDRAEYEQVLLKVRQDVWNAHSTLQEAYELIQTTEAQTENALESLRLAEERYKVGSSTLNDLLDSQTSFARAQADYVGAEWEYRSAESQYEWAQGILGVCEQ